MKFTCIIGTLNSPRYLARTISSVLSQSCKDYEIIVQDGGSSDETLAILERFSKRINWRSEPDAGLYDAWNKALERATGDWVFFLGDDDFLLSPEVLEKSRDFLEKVPDEIDFAYGGMALGREGRPRAKIVNVLSAMYSQFFFGIGLPFPSTFVRLQTLRRQSFDPSFKIAGDFEFTARCLSGHNLVRMPHYVSFMERGGMSDNPKYAATLLTERQKILREWIIPKARLIAECCERHLGEGVEEWDAASE